MKRAQGLHRLNATKRSLAYVLVRLQAAGFRGCWEQSMGELGAVSSQKLVKHGSQAISALLGMIAIRVSFRLPRLTDETEIEAKQE